MCTCNHIYHLMSKILLWQKCISGWKCIFEIVLRLCWFTQKCNPSCQDHHILKFIDRFRVIIFSWIGYSSKENLKISDFEFIDEALTNEDLMLSFKRTVHSKMKMFYWPHFIQNPTSFPLWKICIFSKYLFLCSFKFVITW